MSLISKILVQIYKYLSYHLKLTVYRHLSLQCCQQHHTINRTAKNRGHMKGVKSKHLTVRQLFLSTYFHYLPGMWIILNTHMYICKTQNDVQPLIDVQSSNSCPISKSQTSVPLIYPFNKLWNWLPILKSMSFFKFITWRILTVTNKSAIYRRIWKVCRFENILKSDRDLR